VKTVVVIVILVLVLALGPNLLWLGRSTVRVENRGSAPVEAVRLEVCETTLALGRLAPGEARFELLPRCGETTLAVAAGSDLMRARVCETSVESQLNHVDAWFNTPTKGDCAYSPPPFSDLLILELLW